MPKRFIPAPEYARINGIDAQHLRYLLRNGRLPAKKVGRYWYVEVDAEEGEEARPRVFTVFLHAGGVGKTSLVRDLGFELASRGANVLLIDADPQANLTQWLGADPATIHAEDTLMRVIRGRPLPEPRPAPFSPSVWFVPANLDLALGEQLLAQKPLGELSLRAALEHVGGYDYVFIDSPPSLGRLAVMAALAGQGLLIPVETSAKGLQGLKTAVGVAREYTDILRRVSPGAVGARRLLAAIVPSRYDPRTAGDRATSDALLKGLPELDGVPVTPAISYRPGAHRRATEQRVPVQMAGDPAAASEVRAVADYLVANVFDTRVKETGWAG